MYEDLGSKLKNDPLTQISPKWESPHCPFVSGFAIITFTPGNNLPDSTMHKEFGAPRSTKATRLFRNALKSTYTYTIGNDCYIRFISDEKSVCCHTWALSAELAPCTQIAGLTRHPNDVETHLVLSPNAWNNLQNCCVNWTRGRSSATTTHVRTHAKLTFRCLRAWIELLNALVHSSMTPYEQNVSRTRYWERVLSQRLGFASTCVCVCVWIGWNVLKTTLMMWRKFRSDSPRTELWEWNGGHYRH